MSVNLPRGLLAQWYEGSIASVEQAVYWLSGTRGLLAQWYGGLSTQQFKMSIVSVLQALLAQWHKGLLAQWYEGFIGSVV